MGLLNGKTIAFLAIERIMSWDTMWGLDTPIKMSLPTKPARHRPLEHVSVRDLGQLLFVGIHAGRPPAIERPDGIIDHDISNPESQKVLRDRRAGGAGADHDRGAVLCFPARQLERIDEGRQNDGGRAVLVIVEYGNVQLGPQLLLDLETGRRRHIFELDRPETRRDPHHRFDKRIHVLGLDQDGDAADIHELRQNRRLALHHGQRRQNTDVPQPQNSRPVGRNGDAVADARQFPALGRVLFDLLTRRGHAGSVEHAQIAERPDRHPADHPQRAAFMELQLIDNTGDLHALDRLGAAQELFARLPAGHIDGGFAGIALFLGPDLADRPHRRLYLLGGQAQFFERRTAHIRKPAPHGEKLGIGIPIPPTRTS